MSRRPFVVVEVEHRPAQRAERLVVQALVADHRRCRRPVWIEPDGDHRHSQFRRGRRRLTTTTRLRNTGSPSCKATSS